VKLRAGDGGNGCASFRREKFVPKGGPDGGDGGDGGAVVLECDTNVGDLRTYYFKPQWEAKNGQPGRGQGRNGKNGAECRLKVPAGTVVYEVDGEEPLIELLEPGQEHVLLRGGSGGWGNIHFKSSINQRPMETKEGLPGESGEYRFVLKTIADVGLVGYPNAGKSTLIAALTGADPKTAPYPFTTTNPVVGILIDDERHRRLTLADIPGLIEGAHENKGLGHIFLRHIERCSGLLLMIDMSPLEGREPVDDYRSLLAELTAYGQGLETKPRAVIGTKMDEEGATERLARFNEQTGLDAVGISTLLEDGLDNLRQQLFTLAEAIEE